MGSIRDRSDTSAPGILAAPLGCCVPVDATGYDVPRRFRQRASLRFWRVKSSCPAQATGSSLSGMGAIQMRVRPSQRCAKILWPHFRHLGIRCMPLLHVCGAGHVARAEQGAARAVKVGARCAKPAHRTTWAWRTLTACATMQLAGKRCLHVPHANSHLWSGSEHYAAWRKSANGRWMGMGALGRTRSGGAAWSDH